MSMLFLLAGPAEADHQPPDDIVPQEQGSNDAPFWETYLANVRGITGATCVKLDIADDNAFVMPAEPVGEDWVLLVVKQATDNYLYYDPVAGHSYPSTGDQAPGYSHIIVCSAEEPEETTTTTAPEETTTSTVAETTTTTVAATTTTVGETTTTVEVLETTLTAPESTTSSVADEVLDEEVLPFTGLETGELAIVASALALLGSLALLSARRAED